jgi:RNA polymerase sigma factor (sigma-70 family)
MISLNVIWNVSFLGFRFSTYATWWIRREVLRNVNQQSRTMRLPESAMKKINDIRINERLLMTTLGRKPTDEEVAAKCNLPIDKLWFYRKAAMDMTSLDKEMSNKAGKGSAAGGIASNGKTIGSLVKDLAPTPAEIAAKEMLQSDVRKLIKTLSPREQAVVRLRFGLDDGTPRTLEYIAKKFNVDKEKVRRVEAKALLKLRQPYRNQTVKCYISDL